ncbi:MAG: glutamate-5-semialdehyde dehydrogenase [Dehalococcoidia bacterium]
MHSPQQVRRPRGGQREADDMTTTASELIGKAQAAKAAARQLRKLPTDGKNAALAAIAHALEQDPQLVLDANALDMEAGRAAGLGDALLARLELTPQALGYMIDGVRNVIALPDPAGESFDSRTLGNGMRVERRRVPLGVIGTIFEARPEVPVDISALCIKSGNAVILRGGKEAINTNIALGRLIRGALQGTAVPPDAVQMIETVERSVVDQMVRLTEYIDLLVPRGGAALIRFIQENATVPAITGGIGVVHAYVDSVSDADMAANIILNAKVQAPAKCNALDTVLIHAAAAPRVLPRIAVPLASAGVEMRCDQRALSLLGPVDEHHVKAAVPSDFGQEFLALVLSVRVVDSLDEAIEHIETYGSGHSEVIITGDYAAATRFVDEVDASVVLVNASSRFNDGGQLGLGAEVAISTNKLHARGPMGLRELTTYKWVALGTGQVRQ